MPESPEAHREGKGVQLGSLKPPPHGQLYGHDPCYRFRDLQIQTYHDSHHKPSGIAGIVSFPPVRLLPLKSQLDIGIATGKQPCLSNGVNVEEELSPRYEPDITFDPGKRELSGDARHPWKLRPIPPLEIYAGRYGTLSQRKVAMPHRIGILRKRVCLVTFGAWEDKIPAQKKTVSRAEGPISDQPPGPYGNVPEPANRFCPVMGIGLICRLAPDKKGNSEQEIDPIRWPIEDKRVQGLNVHGAHVTFFFVLHRGKPTGGPA